MVMSDICVVPFLYPVKSKFTTDLFATFFYRSKQVLA